MIRTEPRPPNLLRLLLLVLLLADLGYSSVQYYRQPLDGDVAWNLVPDRSVQPILDSPFGTAAWLEGRIYSNPNRFFCHWSFRGYFLAAPLALQSLVDPVTSVYLAAAIAKLLTHLLLLLLLARAVTGHWRIFSLPFLAVMALLTPFFQANGYRSQIGIVDPSITYTFFYALPAAALLLFLLPFIDRLFHGATRPPRPFALAALAALAVVVCLSGPLNPASIGVLTAVALPLLGYHRLRSLPLPYVLLWGWAAALALYSLWLGTYNLLTLDNRIPLADVYARLPEGILLQFTRKLAWPLLFAGLGINFLLLRPRPRSYAAVLLFAVLYILLLPLGGYRSYRDLVLRYDTILPVTLGCLWLYGVATLALLRQLDGRRRLLYPLIPLTVALAFTLADKPDSAPFDCERAALYRIAASPLDVVPLPEDCPVLGWKPFTGPGESDFNARLLQQWRITERPKRYYHDPSGR